MNTEAILGKMTTGEHIELFVALCQSMAVDQLQEAVREMGDLERGTLDVSIIAACVAISYLILRACLLWDKLLGGSLQGWIDGTGDN